MILQLSLLIIWLNIRRYEHAPSLWAKSHWNKTPSSWQTTYETWYPIFWNLLKEPFFLGDPWKEPFLLETNYDLCTTRDLWPSSRPTVELVSLPDTDIVSHHCFDSQTTWTKYICPRKIYKRLSLIRGWLVYLHSWTPVRTIARTPIANL